MVADNLHAADHLADGEETDALGEDDAASGQLGGAEVAGLVEEVLGAERMEPFWTERQRFW